MRILCTLGLMSAAVIVGPLAIGQDLVNAGAFVTVQPGASLYAGTGGLRNLAGSTFTNAGSVRVDGPLANPGTLDLSTGTLEARGDLTNTGTLRPGTAVVTFSGAADQLLTPGGATLYQVLVNKPTAGANTLRLAGDLTVSHLLTLANGLVTTKSAGTVFTLRLPAGASLSGEASGRYVLGALQIIRNGVGGSAAVDFGHGAVLNPQGNALGTVSITRTAGLLTPNVSYGTNLGATAKGIDRVWAVSPAAQPAAGAPVQLTLAWLPDNDNGLTGFAAARMWQQPAAGQPWTGVGPATDASARSLTASPAALNRFTVSNAANPLPVTLLDFTAQAEGAGVRLAWATASELNNAGFGVERSADGLVFAPLATVAGAGTSSTRHDYALLDARLPAGAALLYYRLAQTDHSGAVVHSPVRAVHLRPTAAAFVVYPTRVGAGQNSSYRYTGPAGPGTLLVTDLVGRVVRRQPVDGRTQGEVPLAGLARGEYLLRYVLEKSRFDGRCVVE